MGGEFLLSFKGGINQMYDKDRKVAEKFKNLAARKIKVYEVRVFGSMARGNAVGESDLDILVVVDVLNHATEKYISDCAWEAGFFDNIIVVPIAVSIDTLKNSPIRESVFIKNVYQEGVVV